MHNIENLMLILNPLDTAAILREGDSTKGPLPSGWVMLLKDKKTLTQAVRAITKSITRN